jgi:hypothetical protein
VVAAALVLSALTAVPAATAAPGGAVTAAAFPGPLFDVSCPGAHDCWAVGRIGDRGAFDHWNGSAWRVLRVPAPTGATSTSLSSVSCAGTASC